MSRQLGYYRSGVDVEERRIDVDRFDVRAFAEGVVTFLGADCGPELRSGVFRLRAAKP